MAFRLILFLSGALALNALNAQNVQWAKALSSDAVSMGRSVAVDSDRNIIISGFANGVVDFDPSSANSNTPVHYGPDSFLAKYTSEGDFLWAFRLDGQNDEEGAKIVLLDSEDNIIIIGRISRVVDFDPSDNVYKRGPQNGEWWPYIAKYSADGQFISVLILDEFGSAGISAADLDSYDNLILTGDVSGSLQYNPSANPKFSVIDGGRQFFILKADKDQNILWAMTPSKGVSVSHDLSIDKNDNILVSGVFNMSDLAFDGTITTLNPDFEGNWRFLSKYDNDGNLLWTRGIRGVSSSNPSKLITDSQNDIIWASDFTGNVYDDQSKFLAFNVFGAEILISKISSSGQFTWHRLFKGDGQYKLTAIESGTNDQIVVSGNQIGDMYFGNLNTVSGTLHNDENGNDPFLAEIEPDGELKYFGNYGTINEENYRSFINDIVFDSDSSYLVTGNSTPVDVDINEGEYLIGDKDVMNMFFARYSNSPPSLISDYNETIEVCSNAPTTLNMKVIDDNIYGLSVVAHSSNQLILNDADILIRVEQDEVILNLNEFESFGVVLVNITVTDTSGDSDSKSIELNVLEGIDAPQIQGEHAIYACKGDQILLVSNSERSNLWSNGETSNQISITEPGEYWVKSINEFGCESENSDTVRVFFEAPPLQPVISASGPLEFCEGDQITLTSDIGENILWSTGETTQSISVSESGVYTVWQQSEICGDGAPSEQVEVLVHPIPEQPLITVSGDTQFCEGGSVTLSTSAAGNISWSNGKTDPSLVVTESGLYTLYVERNGCVSQISDPINIIVDKDFQFNVVSDTTVCEGVERLELTPEVSGGPVDYLWSDGSSSSTLVVDQSGQYWLEVSNGTCEKPRVYIEVSEACYPKVYIPNVFSPNGDGINDTFQITGVRVTNFELNIYNRWGNQVFHSTNLDNAWGGELNGELLPSGSYSYRALYGGELNGQPIQFYKNGVVSLIR